MQLSVMYVGAFYVHYQAPVELRATAEYRSDRCGLPDVFRMEGRLPHYSPFIRNIYSVRSV